MGICLESVKLNRTEPFTFYSLVFTRVNLQFYISAAAREKGVQQPFPNSRLLEPTNKSENFLKGTQPLKLHSDQTPDYNEIFP